MAVDASERIVSVDLQENEENRAVIEAIEADNDQCIAQHIPGLVKLRAPGYLEINRASVEERLGRTWETHAFQMAIVSLAGNISEWDEDRIVISWGRPIEDDDEDEEY
ncbi:monooxygenase [Naumannella sp. ID2617S]|uniref:MmoB/DmpM family protein n=1 Tax=Enemella evansiae TaxID=2016499 RepID=UPI000B9662DC|nr:MmoB/DmpM family protein [Enemella evansiae]NNG18942.1 monooxygenase [Naumannella sp. ID2617S]OYO12467.1 monooxygenase [Enemella evansiae]